jgi:hypothetical protein
MLTNVEGGTALDRQMWAQMKRFDRPCTLFTSSTIIRGYYNSLTKRSIYEQVKNVKALLVSM